MHWVRSKYVVTEVFLKCCAFSTPRTKITVLFTLSSLTRKLTPRHPSLYRRNHASSTYNTDPKMYNAKITHLMRNGLVDQAQKVFDEMPQRSTVSWNAMVRGYFQNGEFDQAAHLFHRMPHRDIFSYNTMISGLMQYGHTGAAHQVFNEMPFKDVVSWNSMIAGYINNSFMSEAMSLFDQMPARNAISCNLVMAGLVNSGSFELAQQIFSEMPERDIASWTIMISGLSSTGRIVEARELFEQMPVRDVRAWNTMLIGYIENDNIEIAQGLFMKMKERDSNSWNGMISGLMESHRINDAVRFFTETPHKSSQSWNSVLLGLTRSNLTHEAHAFFMKSPFNDIISWTNMIIGYFELGQVCTAVKLFHLMPNRDPTVWNATIFGLGENDHGEEGLKMFLRMKEGGPCPDEATFTSVLTICSILPSIDFGKQSHAEIIKTDFDDFTSVSNAIVTMYARCGSMNYALMAFSHMLNHDVVSWNSIICGFAHHGNCMKALEMFQRMRSDGVKLDQITFVGVLSACSYAGLIEQGKAYFDFMRYKCFIQPTSEHFTCMVDLLGRYGFIKEAVSFIKGMREDGVEATASVWGALLGACRIHRNIQVGKKAAEKVLEMEPYNTGVYLILSEMYMVTGKRENAERILVQMKETGAKKQPGCSWIEVNNTVHVFLAGEGSHPEFEKVCFVLNLLTMEMEINHSKGM